MFEDILENYIPPENVVDQKTDEEERVYWHTYEDNMNQDIDDYYKGICDEPAQEEKSKEPEIYINVYN